MADKKELREQFSKEWEKHYKVPFLKEMGFVRLKCEKCGRFFWSLNPERKSCADSSCSSFGFIGKKTKGYSYVETWRAIERYFVRHGHKSIARYPVVARWRDDLYFTNASIIDFQPYVVSGELEPPANPLVVPQPCLRFNDLQNVGATGQHYSAFIMFGQHAFNSKKTGLFYWKNEALEHDFNYLTKVIGVPKQELVFMEDVWAGGGTFGPSMEYLANGVELGNCVFMQFRETNAGYEELKTKVIDMGAGLERLAWYTNGTPTSYDVVFKDVLKKMFSDSGLRYDSRKFALYAKLGGALNIEEGNLREKRSQILKSIGLEEKDFDESIRPVQALYACADHLKALLYAITDGMLPSNSGGGYNLRILLRRVFSFNEEYDLKLDVPGLLEKHAIALKSLDPLLSAGVSSVVEIISEEEQKNKELRAKAGQIIANIVDKAAKGDIITEKELIKLYESNGIAPELIEREASKKGLKIEIPENFYYLIAKKNEKAISSEQKTALSREYPKTKELYYKEPMLSNFKAKVIGKEGNKLILDQTAFYGTSGGQAHDLGKISGVPVVCVEKINGITLHTVSEPEKFRIGNIVSATIDMERRKQLMRHHTATHLLNACCKKLLGMHIWQAGAQKDVDKAHLDVTHYKRITKEQIKELEKMVNALVLANIPVRTFFMARNKAEQKYGFTLYQGGYVPGKELRIVEIPGVDVEACGGTHALRTSEIGFFKIIKRESVQDGIERLTFVCGPEALKTVQEKEAILEEAAAKISVQPHELPKAVERFFSEWKQLRKKVDLMTERSASIIGRSLISEKGPIVKLFIDDTEKKTLIEIGNYVMSKRPDIALVLGSGKDIVVFCGEKSNKKATELLKEVLATLNGKGGGNDRMAIGTADGEKIRAYFSTNR
ncbi:MAG: alanine--tRNA ligase [Candidatus Diapherotrites archaeon]|nr:alanine--tRNA ligase [Candidatus Diapherotrites archaeon]